MQPPSRAPSTVHIPPPDPAGVLQMVTSAIGSEQPNTYVRQVAPSDAASDGRRRAFLRAFVWNPNTQQYEHKQTVTARGQHAAADEKNAPGRLKYMHRTRMAIISEDGEGSGYAYENVYQYYQTTSVVSQLETKLGPLLLEGTMGVGFARIIELRKTVGQATVMHPRLSVKRADATKCTAVVLPFVETGDGRLAVDRDRAPPLLLPLLSLGCKAEVRRLEDSTEYEVARLCRNPAVRRCSRSAWRRACLRLSGWRRCHRSRSRR